MPYSSALSPSIVMENQFQLLIEHSSDAIATFNESLQYVAVNAHWATLVGASPHDLLMKANDHLAIQLGEESHYAEMCLEIHKALQQALHLNESLRIIHVSASDSVEVVYTPISIPTQNELGQTKQVMAIGRETRQRLDRVPSEFSCESASTLEPKASTKNHDEVTSAIIGVKMPGMEECSERYLRSSHEQLASRQEEAAQSVPPDSTPSANASDSQIRDRPATDDEKTKASQIRNSTEFLKLVLDSIPQYIFWKDRDSVYLGCNRRWAEMSGIGDPEQVVGITDADLPWTEEQRAWYLKCDRQVMETGVAMLGIKQSQRQANGQITWRETSKIPIRDTTGEIIGLLGTIEDVTERKRAEDLLKQSEATYKKLAKQEELLNQVSAQIRNSLELETILQTVVVEVRQLLDTDRVVIYEFDESWHGKVVVEDVIEPWVSTLGEMGADNCFPEKFASLYQQGRVHAINDISDANLDDCHQNFLTNLQVKANLIVPILINQKLWGLLIAHHCRDSRNWQETELDLLEYLAGQVGVAIRQAQLYAQAKESAHQSQIQAQQLAKAFHDLQQAQTQLIQTEKMSSLGQLVAGVAHEINNPVNFIYGNISHIDDYTEDLISLINLYQQHYPEPAGDIKEALEDIDIEFLISDVAKILQSLRVGADRIRKIVLSLRNFSRLDEADMKPVDIHEGIDSTLLILQHRLKPSPGRDAINVVKNYGNLPQVECYPSQLNQVFMNILSNAIDALEDWKQQESENQDSSTEAMTITITTEYESDRNAAIIRIHNNGLPIPKRVYDQLFNPFFTTKPIGQGTGLGLSISQQIVVQKHHGQLTCTSRPEWGVEFCIEIPIIQAIAQAE